MSSPQVIIATLLVMLALYMCVPPGPPTGLVRVDDCPEWHSDPLKDHHFWDACHLPDSENTGRIH